MNTQCERCLGEGNHLRGCPKVTSESSTDRMRFELGEKAAENGRTLAEPVHIANQNGYDARRARMKMDVIPSFRDYLIQRYEILVEVMPPGVFLVQDEFVCGVAYLSSFGDRVLRFHSDRAVLKLDLTLSRDVYVGLFGNEAFDQIISRL